LLPGSEVVAGLVRAIHWCLLMAGKKDVYVRDKRNYDGNGVSPPPVWFD
jgi:hypothetical protein